MNTEQKNISEVMDIINDHSFDLLGYDGENELTLSQAVRHLASSLDFEKLKFYECGNPAYLAKSAPLQSKYPNLNLDGESLFKFNLAPHMTIRVHIGLSSGSPSLKTKHYFFAVYSQKKRGHEMLASGFLKDDFENNSLHYHYLDSPNIEQQKVSDLAIDMVHKYLAENSSINSVN